MDSVVPSFAITADGPSQPRMTRAKHAQVRTSPKISMLGITSFTARLP